MPSESANAGLVEKIRRTAAEVLIAGFPLVLADAVRRLHPLASNRVMYLPTNAAAVAPGLANEDALSIATTALLDLAAGPVILHLPNMRGRYFSVTLIDAVGDVVGKFGSRTGQADGGDLAVVGPDWRGELTGPLTALRSTSDQVWAITRICANTTADLKAVETLAGKQSAVPLAGVPVGDPHQPMLRLDPPSTTSLQLVADLTPEAFLHRLNALAERTSGRIRDVIAPTRAPLRELLDLFVETDTAPRHLQPALHKGYAEGFKELRAAAVATPTDASWWEPCGDAPARQTALQHAVRAYRCFGGPSPEDVLGLVCHGDESGRPLDGAERYRIRFAPDAAPPVEAFWSLDASPKAPGPRRARLGDRYDLAFNRDGSLELLIQNAPPPAGRLSNWLPIPSGRFTLRAHLHWPKPAALNGAWRMPPVERLGSGFARRAGGADQTHKTTPPRSGSGLQSVAALSQGASPP